MAENGVKAEGKATDSDQESVLNIGWIIVVVIFFWLLVSYFFFFDLYKEILMDQMKRSHDTILSQNSYDSKRQT